MIPPLLRVLNGEALPAPPVWFMRQAGRYLPEYQALRKQVPFCQLLKDPSLAAEATLQPIRRYPKLDGAIVFSDILVILEALGCGVSFTEEGPRLEKTLDQIDLRAPLNEQPLTPVLETIRRVRKELPASVALLGFAGAPWTLLAYGIEGGPSRTWGRAKTFLHAEPSKSLPWLARLADLTAAFLNLQIQAGADAIQLFDSCAGELDPDDCRGFALPSASRALQQVEGAPRIYFPRASHLPLRTASLPCEALSIPWQVPIQEAFSRFGRTKVLQGNLDPAALLSGREVACRKTRTLVDAMRGRPYVFNLGHGVLPSTDPEILGAILDEAKRIPGSPKG